ncbi:transcriptional regulator [Providencia alcalifaciens]|uniref:Transcriptional regulator n=1 Tax=Providencia alcalifaciens TaxID=126385 RepID=A0A4V2V315_9GAMM|nr:MULTISPECIES: LysR family transcriptional regulator [Providencia]MBC5792252.1 LysR family transcriptional regulator [Providencia sp. JUb39]TCT28140.1 transcriptional regulator [Providencia alcalifaciens]
MLKLYSPESLWAFVEVVSLNSFTLAAHKLGKSQSTISTAIANLEIDLGFSLFDRSFRKPILTNEGKKIYSYALDIIDANENLRTLAYGLTEAIEPCLTLVLTDSYIAPQAQLMQEFAMKFPDVELECIIAEDADAITHIQNGRAHFGIILSMRDYPFDIIAKRLTQKAHLSVYVANSHPLASIPNLSIQDLSGYRQLCLHNIYNAQKPLSQKRWSAPQYLMLMEMAIQQYGWAELPHDLVKLYGQKQLTQLSLSDYPKIVPLDLIWSRKMLLGTVGNWITNRFSYS